MAFGLQHILIEQFKGLGKSEERRMTREEAVKIVQNKCYRLEGGQSVVLVAALEALGLIKFEKETKVEELYHTTNPVVGAIRLEHWPEGYVLWIGGEIVYRSWKV